MLRRLELTYPGAEMGALLASLGPRQSVIPGVVEICDVPELGRILVTRGRVEVTLRLAASEERVRNLVRLLCEE